MLNLNAALTAAAVKKLLEQGKLSQIAQEVILKQHGIYKQHESDAHVAQLQAERAKRIYEQAQKLHSQLLAQQQRAERAFLSAVQNYVSDASILEACVLMGEAVDTEKATKRLKIANIVCASGYELTKNTDPFASHADRQWFVKSGHVCPECFYVLDNVELEWLASNLEEVATTNILSSNCF